MTNEELERRLDHAILNTKLHSEELHELDKRIGIIETKYVNINEKIKSDYERFDARAALDYSRLDARFDKIENNHSDFLDKLTSIEKLVGEKEVEKKTVKEISHKFMIFIYSVLTICAALGIHTMFFKYFGWH